MHSSAQTVQLHGHHHPPPSQQNSQGQQGYHHHQLGPLPQTTYETPAAATTPANNYQIQQQRDYSYNNSESQFASQQDQRNQSSIRWNSNGVSATAERRLPFVHRFRPVNNNQSASGNVLIQPFHHRQPQFQQQAIKQQEKRARNMAQYETNPIGALQERFQSRGIIPDYKFLQTDGASHCPTFTFEVVVGDVKAEGVGQTKKQAKQAAARAMLDILDGRAPTVDGQSDGNKPSVTPGAVVASDAQPTKTESDQNGAKTPGPIVGNKIGMLQEYCVTKGLPMPVYDVMNVGGQPHQRVFTISAKVGFLNLTGEGTSKKDAKREAATKMFERLKGLGTGALPLVNGVAVKAEPGSYPNEDNGGVVDAELIKAVSEMKVDTIGPKHAKQIQQFYGDLIPSKDGTLYNLHNSPVAASGPDFVKFLEELGQEQKFSITYIDIEDDQDDGAEVQFLVQLSSMPVAVCVGFGANEETAKNEAAKNALLYLKAMTKKKNSNEAEKSQRKKK